MTEVPQDVALFERRGPVAILTLNRPQVLNAVNQAMWMGAAHALEDFAHDPSLRVLIITGAGERAFCAGSDLKAKAAGEPDVPEGMEARGYAGIVRHFVDKPVIAAVNGLALGGGTEIALSCDLIVASERASFGLPEARHGLLAGAGGLLRLPRQIPLKVAMHCIMTGEALSADDALRWGLVNRVVPAAQLMPEALSLAARICEASPVSISASKQVVYRGLDAPLDFPADAWAMNERYVRQVMDSDDALEGPRAFLEKRSPKWKD